MQNKLAVACKSKGLADYQDKFFTLSPKEDSKERERDLQRDGRRPQQATRPFTGKEDDDDDID